MQRLHAVTSTTLPSLNGSDKYDFASSIDVSWSQTLSKPRKTDA
jgi:hypothetical protein